MHNLDNYLPQVMQTIHVCYQASCVYFPTLKPNFKDPIENRDRVLALWAELHKAHVPSILLL